MLSPLSRAAETGLAYARRHPELEARTERWDEAAEMRFGAWDNVMVKDLDDDNICHLFYLTQNAVVKPAAPYVRPSDGATFDAENFVEVCERQHAMLAKLNARMAPLAEGDKRPLVIMFVTRPGPNPRLQLVSSSPPLSLRPHEPSVRAPR